MLITKNFKIQKFKDKMTLNPSILNILVYVLQFLKHLYWYILDLYTIHSLVAHSYFSFYSTPRSFSYEA